MEAFLLPCCISHSLTIFIIGRNITGVFGGVVASICFAIVVDLFAPDQKGRVMGYVMFMTFYAAYSTNNLGVQLEDLLSLFGMGGKATILLSPVIGNIVERLGKLKLFVIGTGLAMTMVGVFSFLGVVSFWMIAVLHTLLFLGITTWVISSAAIATDVPREKERGFLWL